MSIHKFFSLSILILIIIGSNQYAHTYIMQTATLAPIAEAFKEANEDTLVALDMDQVLVEATDQILHPLNKKHYWQLVDTAIDHLSGEERALHLSRATSIRQESSLKLIDTHMVSLIHQLQERHIKTMVLTGRIPGLLGTTSHVEDWAAKMLKSFGIDLSNAFPHTPLLILEQLHGTFEKRSPLFKAGILLCNFVPKGRVLEEFLARISYKPTTIIFVDDELKNVQSVEEMCRRNGIQFIGFHYTASRDKTVEPLYRERAQRQIDTLINEGRWLNDTQAEALLAHPL